MSSSSKGGCGAGCLMGLAIVTLVFSDEARTVLQARPYIAVVVLAIPVVVILYHHAIALKDTLGKTPRVEEGEEPAIKQYFFSTAWTELQEATATARETALARYEGVFEVVAKMVDGGCLFLPVILAYIALPLAAALVASVVSATVVVLHAAILIVCSGVLVTLIAVLRGSELVSMAVRRIYLVCPNRDCHRRIALPSYRCPQCAAVHKALLPGSYGAFRRRCRCGTLLPTLFLLGRGRIPAYCPHESCGRPLSEAIGSARDVHIAVVGGPSVGKTAFLTAAMIEIRRRGAARMTFPERSDELAFQSAAERFERGITVDKTAGASPNATLVWVDDARQGQCLLYIYDAAGELYAGISELRRQNFFAHANGVALLVDPFSIDRLRIDRAGEIPTGVRASAEAPQGVYDRVVMTLREHRGAGTVDLPLAVVVTKVDALDIRDQPMREWLLQNGERNLVQSAEHDFKTVRFFACSALGRTPSAGPDPFMSHGVVQPFAWLAETSGVHLQ